MDSFGVQKESLKAIAKKTKIPYLWSVPVTKGKEAAAFDWLGVKMKNITTLEERSASGLNKTAGVIVMEIDDKSVIKKSKLLKGDVIIEGEGEEINTIQDFMRVFQGHNWTGKINLIVFRNQKPLKLKVDLK